MSVPLPLVCVAFSCLGVLPLHVVVQLYSVQSSAQLGPTILAFSAFSMLDHSFFQAVLFSASVAVISPVGCHSFGSVCFTGLCSFSFGFSVSGLVVLRSSVAVGPPPLDV